MNQKLNRISRKIVKLLLIVVLLGMYLPAHSTHVLVAQEVEYEIYPIPHSITYEEESYIIRPAINVVFEGAIDEATRNRLYEVLAMKDKDVTISESIVAHKTNILIGIHDSGEYVDQYVQHHYEIDASLFTHLGSHYVISDKDVISIYGSDTDAAFYGLTSLKHIFKQMEGSTIRNFTIKDYADTETRGFIEGYYGNPWSYEDRMSLMEFGGDFKMTSYVFAPKNDPYHTKKWRELYPEAEIKEIKAAAAVGNASKCRFVWTAHPFMGGFDSTNIEGEIQALLNKFEQLYDADVRQFGVLGDDVGSLDRTVVTSVMQAVSEWAKQKGDVYDVLFCPAGYNHNTQSQEIGGDYAELNDYDASFSEDIQIFWTGEVVRGAVEQKTLDHFRDYKAVDGERRAPLFWLNWPVNDGTTEQRQSMKMGRADLLKQNVNPEDLMGVVTNPMQEAEASKISLFAIADYSWNVKSFDVNKSWEDSFTYVEEDATESLKTLAKHMSLDGHESKDLVPLLNEVKTKLSNNEPLGESGTKLIYEMEVIMEACEEFKVFSKNENLKKELEPFMGSLKDLAAAIKEFTIAANAIAKQDFGSALKPYTNATGFLTASQNHVRESRGGLFMVTPAKRQLIPMGNFLNEVVSEAINNYVEPDDDKGLVITASSSFSSFYEGRIENIIDGKEDTYAWYGSTEAAKQYYQLNFSEPTTIYGIHILNGAKAGKEKDTFGYAKVTYTTDGEHWLAVNDVAYGEYASTVDLDVELANITGLRYECSKTGTAKKWPSMREFSVDLTPDVQPAFTMEAIHPGTDERWSIYSGSDENLMDGDDTTAVHYRVRSNGTDQNSMIAGDYIGVALSNPIVLGKLHILQGKNDTDLDYIQNGTLQYSMDGEQWITIQIVENQRLIDIDLSSQNITAKYIRLLQNKTQKNWLHMREFHVSAKGINDGRVYTNKDDYEDLEATYTKETNDIHPVADVQLNSGQFIGLAFDRIHELREIICELSATGLSIETSKNTYEWKAMQPGQCHEDARYIRIMNYSSQPISFDIEKFVVNTHEFKEIALLDFKGYNATVKNPTQMFDGNWDTETHFVGTQYKDNYMIYDLGQTIQLNSLKLISKDSESNFPRHGKFSVSEDGQTWTDIMCLGNQDGPNPGEEKGTEDIAFVYPENDANYRFKAVGDLAVKARYLKYTVTRDIEKNGVTQYRQLKFYELVMNEGEYIPTTNDPTFTSDAAETRDGMYHHMIDGNISTMFIPNKDKGSLTYSVSEKNTANTIKIIQNSSVISNAKVSARVYEKPDDWLDLGMLSQVVNEYTLPKNTVLLDIKITWDGVIPNVMELLTYDRESVTIDKVALEQLLQHPEDTSSWTKRSKASYEQALGVGKEVFHSEYASQAMVDNSVEAIIDALSNRLWKGDYQVLEELVANAETEQSLYTLRSWRNYELVIRAAIKALTDKENLTEEMIEDHKQKIIAEEGNLMYNPSKREEATLLLEDSEQFIANISANAYTLHSYQAMITNHANLKSLVLQNEQRPVSPKLFEAANRTLKESKDSLVLVLNLPLLLLEFAQTDASLYYKESFDKYSKEIEKGKKLLMDGNADEIKKIIHDIGVSKANLALIYTYESITKLVNFAKSIQKDFYTEATYHQLHQEIERVSTIDIKNSTNEEWKAIGDAIQHNLNCLVSIEALRNMVTQAVSFDKNDYVTSTYHALQEAINKGKALYKDGSMDQINQSIQTIEAMMRGLKIKVNKAEVKQYIAAIKEIDVSKYTVASASNYLDAHSTLKKLLEDLDEVSEEDFSKAKMSFESALDGLVLLSENKPMESVNTSDTNHTYGILLVLASSFTGFLILKKVRKSS